MDMSGFYTKWIRDIMDAQSPAGAFSDISPRVVDMADGAPAWAEAGLVVPWTLYQSYGDRRVLERNFDAMRRYVDLLVEANPNLLWLNRRNNDFGDWVPAGESTNKDLIASAYLAFDLRLLSDVARVIGDTDASRKYEALAYRSRVAFNERFLGLDGRYLGDTQTAYAMAFAMDLVPRARRPQVIQRFVDSIERRQGHLATGFIGTAFLLPALTEAERPDLAYQILQATEYPSWGYMIGNGATTIWELWNSNTEGPAMNSRNHFAFGTVAEWMQRYMVGIDTSPDGPGYRQILIRPRLGEGITQARGEYDSHHGTIVSDWKMDGDRFILNVTVPVNTTATVYIPRFGNARVQVREGGVPVWRNGRFTGGRDGVMSGAAQGDAVVLAIGSGTYSFVSADPNALN
jgi:alpha-L-rhamnosidase